MPRIWASASPTSCSWKGVTKDSTFQDAAGNFSPVAFAQTLRNIGMTEQGYLQAIRENNLRRQILTTVGTMAGSPEVLVVALNRYNGETRVLRYVLVPQSAAGAIPDPTEDDLKRYYENHRLSSLSPSSARSAFSP